jgi:hypothetical protein
VKIVIAGTSYMGLSGEALITQLYEVVCPYIVSEKVEML